MHPTTSDHRQGFTLIELLAVIAVISILTAIIFPAVASVRNSSNTAKCANNLRQIGAGLLLYAGENNGILPPGGTWDREIADYLGAEKGDSNWENVPNCETFNCPVDTTERSDGNPRSYMASAYNPNNNSVGVFSRWSNGAEITSSARLAQLSHPSNTIMIVENFTQLGVQFSKSFAYLSAPGWSVGSSKIPKLEDGSLYHSDGHNYLFCDGHVENLKVEELSVNLPNWSGGHWRAL